MDIETSANSIKIIGNIKSVNDFQEIKTALEALKTQHSNIKVEITDSLSITSSVIGYFNKLVLKDKIRLQLKIGDPQLMELIDDLNLSSVLNATKV